MAISVKNDRFIANIFNTVWFQNDFFSSVKKWILGFYRFVTGMLFGFHSAHPVPVESSTNCHVSQDGELIYRRTPTEDEINHFFEIPDNLFKVLEIGKTRSDNGNCLGHRPEKDQPYVWLSYQDVIDRSKDFGAGLLALGATSDSEYLVGIFAKTCLEWTIAEYGCLAYGLVTAPFYDTLGSESCIHAVTFQEVEMMVCGGETQVDALSLDGHFPPCLKIIITIETLNEPRVADIGRMGVRVYTMEYVEELGRRNPTPIRLASSDSVASLIFTSGTTGIPKAAMLTHHNFLTALKTCQQEFLPRTYSPDDIILGYLPLAHIMERLWEKIILVNGGRIGYLYGNVMNLLTDSQELRPTHMLFVPRVMEKIRSTIMAKFRKNFFLYLLGRVALAWKFHQMEAGYYEPDTWCDKLIFRNIQTLLGGRIRGGGAGSASSDGKLINFMRSVLSCYIFEGYGLTEACGVVSSVRYGDLSAEHVGEPCVGVDVKFEDVPELGYSAENSCGEICVRSEMVMKGYRRMPEKTEEALKNGWLYTGDIGVFTPEGKLKIIDRKKHIFKLSQGEYIAPERLESIYSNSKYILSIFVDGDSRYPYPVALVCPNIAEFPGDSMEYSEEFITAKILEDLKQLADDSKLKHYEVPGRIHLVKEPFTVENGCLTQTQKTRREIVRSRFRDDLRSLYNNK